MPWWSGWSVLRETCDVTLAALSSLPSRSGRCSSPNAPLTLNPCWLDVGLNFCLHTWDVFSRIFTISATLGNISKHASPICLSLLASSFTNSISIPAFGVFLLHKTQGVSSRKKIKCEGSSFGVAVFWCCLRKKSLTWGWRGWAARDKEHTFECSCTEDNSRGRKRAVWREPLRLSVSRGRDMCHARPTVWSSGCPC